MTVASRQFTDFGSHIAVALSLPGETTHISYPLFHAAFRLVKILLPGLDNSDVAVLAILSFLLPQSLIVFSLLSSGAARPHPQFLIVMVSLGLTILSPITIWTHKLMLGYVNPIVYHNPTILALRLFAIPMSVLLLRVFNREKFRGNSRLRIYTVLLCASVLLLTTLAKPSYTIALIPGCCLFAAWQTLRRKEVDWLVLVLGICVPGTLMLGLQYLLTYVGYTSDSSVSIGFLTVMSHWIPKWRVPIQLLLSLVFPISVYILYFREARKNLYLNLSWTIFGVSTIMTYFLYETGSRIDHGNFIWNSYITVFVLMFASMLVLIERPMSETIPSRSAAPRKPLILSRKRKVAFVFFAMHVLSGLAYYLRYMEEIPIWD